MVLMESAVSGHHQTRIRERLADKLEFLAYDPYIQQESLYRERKKIRSMKSTWSPKTYSPNPRVSSFNYKN